MDFQQIEQFVFDKMSETHLPGLSMALVADDQLVWSRGFGFRDLTHGDKATPQTRYAIGSVTKSFTAIAILQLAEQGKLSLNDPVEKFLPGFKIRPMGEKIRIWHLLSHSSGLPGLGFSEARLKQSLQPESLWLPVESHEAILYFLKDAADWVVAKPGERYFYLNEGFILLGAILERLTGMTYNNYVKHNILEPLGMGASSFEYDDYMTAEDRATPYLIRDGKQNPAAYTFIPVNAKGGLISTAEDLARYVRMHINAGELDGRRVMSAESSKEMQKGRVRTALEDSPFGEISYALGLSITDNFYGLKQVGHGGSVSISTSYIGFVPKKKVGVALITNGSGYATSQFGQYALALMLGKDPEALPFIKQEKLYSRLCGLYDGYHKTTQVKVKQAGDYLMLSLIDDRGELAPVPLTLVSASDEGCVFETLSGGGRMEVPFTFEHGRVTLLFERYGYRKSDVSA